MSTVTVEEMQRDLLSFLHRVEAGETFVVVQADRKLAEIKPPTDEERGLRPIGLYAGQFTVPDDFDDPLPDEVIAGFEGR